MPEVRHQYEVLLGRLVSSVIWWLALGVTAVVFAISAIGKTIDGPSVDSTLAALGVEGHANRRLLRYALVGAEVGVLLLIAAAPLFGLLAGLGFLLALAALGWMREGERVPCSCFGRGGGRLGRAQAGRNVGLAAIAALGLLVGPQPPLSTPAAWAVCAAMAVVIVVTSVHADELVAVFGAGTIESAPGRRR